jgi:hypothetical protein
MLRLHQPASLQSHRYVVMLRKHMLLDDTDMRVTRGQELDILDGKILLHMSFVSGSRERSDPLQLCKPEHSLCRSAV